MTHLNEQTRARIHAEEEYRAQVRAELAEKGTPLGPTLTALVAGLALLLLLLGGLWFLAQPVE